MPSFIPTPNVATLHLNYDDTSGRPFSNGLSFMQDNPWTVEGLTLLCTTAQDAWEEALQAQFVTGIRLRFLRAVSQEAVDAPSVVLDIGVGGLAGTRAGLTLPLHSCCSVTLRTDKRGRSFRGRVFHTGLGQNDLANPTTWLRDSVGDVTSGYNVFCNAIETATESDNVVISRQQDMSHLLVGDPTIVVGYTGHQAVATQRGRVRH